MWVVDVSLDVWIMVIMFYICGMFVEKEGYVLEG